MADFIGTENDFKRDGKKRKYVDQTTHFEEAVSTTLTTLPSDVAVSDDAAFTPGTTKIIGAGHFADETSTDSVDEGDIGAPRMTLDRKAIVTPYAHTAGGADVSRDLDADETSTQAKATAGQVYGLVFTNTATLTRWLKLYDHASPTVGTTTPKMTIGLPGNASDDVSGAIPFPMPVTFGTAISFACVTEQADSGTTAPAANDVTVNLLYK